jgi:hypothetical protein
LLLAKIITAISLGAEKIQRLTLKLALIAPYSHKNRTQQASEECPASIPGKKASCCFSFFSSSSSPNKQKTEHQSESNPATSWKAHGKPPYTMLH